MAANKRGLAGGGAGKARSDRLSGAIDYPHSTPRRASKPVSARHPDDARPVADGLIRGLAGAEVYGDVESATFIRERIRELARSAFAAQGRAAFESTLRAAALHEAGHAITYSALGVTVTRVCVRRRWGQWLGRTLTDGGPRSSGPESAPRKDLDHAAIVMAGVASEMLFDAAAQCDGTGS